MRPSWSALLLAVATTAASAALVVSCGDGGNGQGTAPKQPDPCPDLPPDLDAGPVKCTGPQVCSYDLCGDSGPCSVSGIVALCPSANDTWRVSTRGDGGTFSDAPLEETSADADAATDGESDAADAESDAPADTATDSGADTATDSGTDAATDTASDTAADTSDAGADTATDVSVDLGVDVALGG